MNCEPLDNPSDAPATVLPMVQLLRDYWEWVARGQFMIKLDTPDGPVVRPLVPNELQRKMYEEWLAQALAGLPVRNLDYKSRKMGCSTFSLGLAYYMVKTREHMHAVVVAHTDQSTRDLFEIVARAYVYDPDHKARPAWPDGSALDFMAERDSKLSIRTFGGQYPLSSATLQFLLISELAKVQGDKEYVQGQLMSLLNAVKHAPMTFVALESTANRADESGEFEARAREAERGIGPYSFVFGAWHEEPTYAVEGPPLEPLTDDLERKAEDELVARRPYLSDAQLRWRRVMIRNLHGLRNFQQEYPDNPEEGFQVASGRVFPSLRRERHAVRRPVDELLAAGYELYRGIDWGGADPFVCLLVAHKPDVDGQFTVDDAACPETWRELTHLLYDGRGKPRDRDNHAVDALRYAVTYFNMTGHVHVAAEVYEPNFAIDDQGIDFCADRVFALTADWPIVGTVGDRSRLDSLASFRAAGIPIAAYEIRGVTGRGSEIMYGVDRLNELMMATGALRPGPPPPTPEQRHARLARLVGHQFGFARPRVTERPEAVSTRNGRSWF